ncbi:hypothetical protein JKF63_04595 [Porcisia hertigi]|uniref:Uncharacterized protein n=1 Tax=Porcisia hertigi TaxID=2761500 RepID=A0A836HN27_9TRYP|nr:hypothetical protein JKF63_04595 [Porcisia hertigi]
MSAAATQVSLTTEARPQSEPLLISCLHASAVSAPPAEVRRAFDIIERLLSNRAQRPAEPRYASFSATSTAWVDSVLPFVNVLDLVAWMGCQWATEGTRLVFLDRLGKEHAADRLDELRCVASVWNVSDAETSPDASRHYEGARQRLIEFFHSTHNSTNREELWARLTSHLQLNRLLAYARDAERQRATLPSQVTLNVPSREGSAAWTVRAQRELDDTARASNSRPCSDVQHSPQCECEAFVTCLANDSIRWMHSHASLCELRRVCENAAAESASRSDRCREEGVPASVSRTPRLSSTVAERLRQRAQGEQHQRYLQTTGPAYRQLSQEERHRGESLIVSVAALLEQIAVVSETQGMVRHDRHEARRLMDEFRRDGDLVKLYQLEEKYTAELEEAKLLYGKPLVYAASWEE